MKLTFLSYFTGIVDFMHMDPEKSMSYSPDQVVRRVDSGVAMLLTMCLIFSNISVKLSLKS